MQECMCCGPPYFLNTKHATPPCGKANCYLPEQEEVDMDMRPRQRMLFLLSVSLLSPLALWPLPLFSTLHVSQCRAWLCVSGTARGVMLGQRQGTAQNTFSRYQAG